MEDEVWMDELTDTAIFQYEPEKLNEWDVLEDEREVVAEYFL